MAVAERLTGAENVIWDLSVFYAGIDDPMIESDMQKLNGQVDTFADEYRGRVAQLDAEEMMDALKGLESIFDLQGRIASFARLLYSTDTNNPQYGALVQKNTEFNAQLEQKLIFFDLEWNEAEGSHVQNLLADPTLGEYRHYLEAKRRYQPHQLSEVEEQLMVEKDVTGRAAWTRFFTQLLGALRLDYEGEKLTLTQVLTKLHDEDREVRRKANDAITAALQSKAMELTYVFNVLVADKSFEDKRRGYATWVSSRNLDNKAPDAVVDALVQAVTSNFDIVARHYRLKRALLGLDELREYDRYAPLPVKESDSFYVWNDARDVVLKAFDAFSPQVGDVARKFFDGQWIHAPVTPGKRGGAFASPTVPSAHPFVFVNYEGQTRDVMTLAHELGHGIHMYLSAQKSGLFGLYTPLTTAEMASTFAEMLVFSDLMNREPDAEARLAMLAHKIEDSFATVFRQVAMNRFEDKLHNTRRTQGELTTEQVNGMWMETQRQMFGDSVNLSDDYGQWWSYVSHFVAVPGYVYAYAFGELLVLALFNLYKERGAAFVPQFIEVLAAGDSDWPDQILAKIGVDLTDLNFWNEGLNALRELVDQEEQLARELYPDKF
jgi:oligoendopeptidase F